MLGRLLSNLAKPSTKSSTIKIMPKKPPELSAYMVRRIKRAGLHAVGGVSGLYLLVKPTGASSWILRVKVGDRRPDIGLGGFPDVTLEQARDEARKLRQMIRDGIDPVEQRRAAKDALKASQAKRITFAAAAKQCHRAKATEFRSAKHRQDWIRSLELYAVPVIGSLPVDHIELPHVVEVLKPIWETRTETATRTRQRIEAVLAWATVSGYRTGDNPARWQGNLEHVLPKPAKIRKVSHHAALPWADLPAFMADLRKREGMGARALEFAILTATRSGEVRLATWDEIDLAAKLWTIQPQRMKAGKAHKVPLSDAAVDLLRDLPRFQGSPYVFPAVRGGALSDMSLSAVCRRMEVKAVPHGFRSTFKDWCRSSTSYADEVSELALAHVSTDATRAAYARDELLPKRTRLMRDWARYCYSTPTKATVTKIRATK